MRDCIINDPFNAFCVFAALGVFAGLTIYQLYLAGKGSGSEKQR